MENKLKEMDIDLKTIDNTTLMGKISKLQPKEQIDILKMYAELQQSKIVDLEESSGFDVGEFRKANGYFRIYPQLWMNKDLLAKVSKHFKETYEVDINRDSDLLKYAILEVLSKTDIDLSKELKTIGFRTNEISKAIVNKR